MNTMTEQRALAVTGRQKMTPSEAFVETLVAHGVRDVFGYLGVTDFHSAAIEYGEFADDRLKAAIAAAEQAVDDLVDRLVQEAERQQAA